VTRSSWLDRILPPSVDNTYRGQRLAPWLLVALVAVKVVMGVNSIVNGASVASSADGIPLDAFPSTAARTVVALFSLVGLSHLVIGLLGALVLIRYRALVPFIFAVILLDHAAGQLILQAMPIATTGTAPGGAINLGLFALEITGFALSLWVGRFSRRTATPQRT